MMIVRETKVKLKELIMLLQKDFEKEITIAWKFLPNVLSLKDTKTKTQEEQKREHIQLTVKNRLHRNAYLAGQT